MAEWGIRLLLLLAEQSLRGDFFSFICWRLSILSIQFQSSAITTTTTTSHTIRHSILNFFSLEICICVSKRVRHRSSNGNSGRSQPVAAVTTSDGNIKCSTLCKTAVKRQLTIITSDFRYDNQRRINIALKNTHTVLCEFFWQFFALASTCKCNNKNPTCSLQQLFQLGERARKIAHN